MYRTETDFIGTEKIPATALYGLQSFRAKSNFPYEGEFHKEWFEALGVVKLACYETYQSFKNAALKKYQKEQLPISFFDDDIISALKEAATEVADGKHYNQFVVSPYSGGAGTSINMNINEIVANLTLKHLGKDLGNYSIIHPIEHANIYQSTNDVVPTALTVAAMRLLTVLENEINKTRAAIEKLETRYRDVIRIGYTQMQEAVPSTYGKLFSAYSDALSRDWWRVSKCFERIKVVNLGGSAIGTGMAVPRFFIMEVVQNLQKLTNLPVTRGENLCDATSNLDTFVEVHAILKSHAVNVEKMVSDIRLLAADLMNNREMKIAPKQIGSTVMPGKVNPVIPEYAISISHKVYANDQLITSLSGMGCLELNAYLPTLGHALLESLKMLISVNKTIQENLLEGLHVDEQKSEENVYKSASVTTALTPYIGYNTAALLAKEMKERGCSVFEANSIIKVIDPDKLRKILDPKGLTKLGYSLDDIL